MSASYSQPGRPLQFSHGRDGMHSEFTLMTIGETRNMPTPSESRAGSTIAGSRSQPSASAEANQRNKTTAMPPPSRPASRILKQPGSAKPISPSPRPSEEFESLFVPAEPSAEEQQWDPAQYQDEEETLGWDASASNVRIQCTRTSQWPTYRNRILGCIQHSETASPILKHLLEM